MKIIKFGCKAYKAFCQDSLIEMRPLTLLYGKNNSGKSSLLRLPRLLLRALSSRTGGTFFPVKVDNLEFASNFRELTHGALAHGSASFLITLEEEQAEFEKIFDLSATVQNIQNLFPSDGELSEFSVISKLDINAELHLEWEPQNKAQASYRGKGEIPFRGLLPDSRRLKGKGIPNYEDWREYVQDFENQISHLGPIRSDIPRVFESGMNETLGFDGVGAVSLLGKNRDLLALVSDWIETHLDGWHLSLDYAGNAYHCLLQRGNISVDLADVGHGIQQVLPVLVQQLSHQTSASDSLLDLVEQPELHLHTAAHAPLGDLFLETARLGKTQVLVETHSENLLLRIRRRIAEGEISPDLIALYFVEENSDGCSTVKPIDIATDGSLAWWPEGVFTEGYEELKALTRAARSAAKSSKT